MDGCRFLIYFEPECQTEKDKRILVGLLLGHGSLKKGFVPSRVEILCGESVEAIRQACTAVSELVANKIYGRRTG